MGRSLARAGTALLTGLTGQSSTDRFALPRMAARRFLMALPVLFGVTLLTFFVLDILPGNAAQQLLGETATPAQIAQLETELDLNRPAWRRYVGWLTDLLHGDLGRSLASGQPVSELIAERFPVTLELVFYAFSVSLGLAIPVALMAVRRAHGFADRLIFLTSTAGLSVANYVLGLLLVLVFAVTFSWFPAIGFMPISEGIAPNLRSLTLPAIAVGFPLFCFYTRFLRADLLEQIQEQDYVLTAIAKGLGPWRVLTVHVLRNSVLGVLALVGLNFGTLFGGTVVIEQIFALPGIGLLLMQAINTRDVTIVQGVVLLLTVITVLATLAIDLLHAALDPRICRAR